MVYKRDVKGGIVHDDGSAADKIQKLLHDRIEPWASFEKVHGDAVDRQGTFFYVPIGKGILVITSLGDSAVNDLYAPNLNDTVPFRRVEPRGLGI